MEQRVFEVSFGAHRVRYAFRHPETRWRFRKYIHSSASAAYDVMAAPAQLEEARGALPPDSADDYVEYRALIGLTSHALLRQGCCILHAVCFAWQGYAWLLSAPSGTGKTTQYKNWQSLFPGEISMICGDMPALDAGDEAGILVHSSPWNGKESYGTRGLSAPLGGIVFLEQGKENRVLPLPATEAVPLLLRQLTVRPESEEEIFSLSTLAERTLRAVPVWRLTNRGDADSTEMLRNTLAARLEQLKGGPAYAL